MASPFLKPLSISLANEVIKPAALVDTGGLCSSVVCLPSPLTIKLDFPIKGIPVLNIPFVLW